MFRLQPTLTELAILTAQVVIRGSMGWATEPPPEQQVPIPKPPEPTIITDEERTQTRFVEEIGESMAYLNDLGWSWERIVKQVGHWETIDDIQQWKVEFGESTFEQVDQDSGWADIPDEVAEASELQNCKIVNQNMGSRGMRNGWDQVVHVMSQNPSIATFQEIKVPRHKLLALQKLVSQHFPNYSLFTNIACDASSRGVPHGVATLVRQDLMNDIKIPTPSERLTKLTEGRILAIQVRGAGAKKPITVINVYQAVSKR